MRVKVQRVLKRPLVLILILVALLSIAGCKSTNASAAQLQIKMSLLSALEEDDAPGVLERSQTLLKMDPPLPLRVWSLGHALVSARDSKKFELLPGYIEQMSVSLPQLLLEEPSATLPPRSFTKKSYQQAEVGVREAHANAYFRWKGGTGDTSAENIRLMTSAARLYRESFVDTILLSDVLWREAEVWRVSGNLEGAIEAYELLIKKDFMKKYRKKAEGRIADVWVAASQAAELPKGIKVETLIPTPHKEWMEITERQIKSGVFEYEEDRRTRLRMAEVNMAYGHFEVGHEMYSILATEADDPIAVKATLQSILAASTESPERYQIVRESLSSSYLPFVWSDPEFREGIIVLAQAQLAQDPPLKEVAYSNFKEIASSEKDEAAIKAAKIYLQYAAEHESVKKFRTIRKSLQSIRYLKKSRNFILLVVKLKKEIEGKP